MSHIATTIIGGLIERGLVRRDLPVPDIRARGGAITFRGAGTAMLRDGIMEPLTTLQHVPPPPGESPRPKSMIPLTLRAGELDNPFFDENRFVATTLVSVGRLIAPVVCRPHPDQIPIAQVNHYGATGGFREASGAHTDGVRITVAFSHGEGALQFDPNRQGYPSDDEFQEDLVFRRRLQRGLVATIPASTDDVTIFTGDRNHHRGIAATGQLRTSIVMSAHAAGDIG